MADEVRPGVRVGDAERESTAALLRRHAADGRLTLDEVDERMRDAYAAKTVADLNVLLEDLPAIRTDVELVKPSDAPVPRRTRGAAPGDPSRLMWASWASVSLMNVIIWAVICLGTTDWIYPWWVWVAGPWGAALAAREIQARSHRRELEG